MKKILTIYFLLLLLFAPLYCQNAQEYFYQYFGHNISNFGVVIHTETPQEDTSVVSASFNDTKQDFKLLQDCNNIYELSLENVLLKNFSIKIPQFLKIKSVYIYNGAREFFFNDLTEFEQKKNVDGSLELLLPEKIWHKSLLGFNNRGYFHQFKMLLMSYTTLAVGHFHFLLLPIYFALAYLLLNYKTSFKKLKDFIERYFHFEVAFLLALALLLRLHDAGYYELWYDEYFSVNIGGNYKNSWMMLFSDPGNPPFYYFLIRLAEYILPINAFYMRLASVLIGTLFVGALGYLSYFIFKNKLLTLSALLVAGINPGFIVASQMARGYGFSMLCLTILVFLVYKLGYLKETEKKNFILLALLGVMFINTHYYNVLYLGGTFFFLAFFFKMNKERIDVYIKLILSYSVIGLSFLPFFFLRALNGAWNDKTFNNWLEKFSFEWLRWEMHQAIPSLTLPILLFILAGLFYTKFIQNYMKEKDNRILFVVNYSLFMILFVFVSAVCISFVRNIIAERYFTGVFALMLIATLSISMIQWRFYALRLVGIYLVIWTIGTTITMVSYLRTHLVMNTFASLPAFFEETDQEVFHLCTPDIVNGDNLLTVSYPENLNMMDRCYLPMRGAENLVRDKNARLLLTDNGFPQQNDFFFKQKMCVIINQETKRRYIMLKNEEPENESNYRFLGRDKIN